MKKTNLRERKKRRTRRDLVKAAHNLFLAQGYDNTTVDEVAEAAEVSRRTLFRYFPSKESLVFPDIVERQKRFRTLLRSKVNSESAFQAIRRGLVDLATEYIENRDTEVARLQIVNSSPSLIAAERNLDFGWEDAIYEALIQLTPPGPHRKRWARTLGAAIFGVVRTTVREWVASEGQTDLVTLGLEALDMLANGFGLTQTVSPVRSGDATINL